MLTQIAAVFVLFGLALLTPPIVWADATYDSSDEFVYPLVTRRPFLDREFELRVDHEKSSEGRVTELRGSLEIPVLPRWRIGLEIPLVFTDPRDQRSMGGIGDLTLENKFLLYKFGQRPGQVAAGFEVRFPTGSERRGLGGEAAIEPFLTAGIAFGAFDFMAEIAYEFNVNANVAGANKQELAAGLAVGYRLSRWFLPLLELTTRTVTRGAEDDPLVGATQVSLTPGFNVRPWPETTFALGIELPVTQPREFDYAVRARFIREF
jgi:hypothetical protein